MTRGLSLLARRSSADLIGHAYTSVRTTAPLIILVYSFSTGYCVRRRQHPCQLISLVYSSTVKAIFRASFLEYACVSDASHGASREMTVSFEMREEIQEAGGVSNRRGRIRVGGGGTAISYSLLEEFQVSYVETLSDRCRIAAFEPT